VTGGAVLTAAKGGAARRLVQTMVIFLVLAAAAAAGALGLTLATSADAQFLGAFTSEHGPHLAVTVDVGKVTPAQLARTAHLPGVTRAAGPYPETAVFLTGGTASGTPAGRSHPPGVRTESPPGQSPNPSGKPSHGSGPSGQPAPRGGPSLPSNPLDETPSTGLAVAGRASPSGPLDDITVRKGRWATRPGEIVIDPNQYGDATIGSTVTVTSAPGKPKLTVVGLALSVTEDQEAWVVPSQLAALRAKSEPVQEQMLYTFTHAATTGQVSADLAELKAALPAGAVTNSVSWLDLESSNAQIAGLNTPFVVAFAIIGLVLAVLITANVVSAAVVAGYRRIGVLKSIGFTPAQVAASYLAQIGMPALAGAIAGTALGDWWVLPELNGGPFAAQPVPLWINITVPLALLALTGLVALVPARRAGRLSAVAAMSAGQAPRTGHGYAAHRLAARLALPRPVSIGLAAPFTRPARSAATVAAVTFGLTAVVLATGLDTSLAKINAAATQPRQTAIVGVGLPPGKRALTPRQQQAITAALRAQPGTLSYVAIASGHASVPGAGSQVPVTAYRGDAAALGWDITSGTWYTRPGQVVVNTARHGTAHLTTGQAIRMTVGGATVTAKITGQVYAPSPLLGALLTSEQTFTSAHAGLPVRQYEAEIRPGTGQRKYTAALTRALGQGFTVLVQGVGIQGVGLYGLVDTSLIRLLTILVAVLAGLGVLNSVLMLTRERVHDLGIFKALGMTPPQSITMVTCWIIAPAIAAAIIALPAGMALQNAVMHAIAGGQPGSVSATSIGSLVHVYTPGGLALLALAGLAIAITGALGPAAWAAASRTTTALRAE
jgi:putative ABC transport system permease protein